MKAEILFQSCMYGIKFWEVKVIEGERNHRIDILVKEMKRLGVASTLRSVRKVELWLNDTDEGQKYLAEKVKKKVPA